MPPKPKCRRGKGASNDLFHYNNTVELTFQHNQKRHILKVDSSSDEEPEVTLFKPESECSVIDSSSSDEQDELCTPPKRVDNGEHKVDRPITPPPDQIEPDVDALIATQMKFSRDFGAKIKSLQAVSQQDQLPLTNTGWQDLVLPVDQSGSPSLADTRIRLKIRTIDGVERIQVLMSDRFDRVIGQLATKYSVPVEAISLSFTDQDGNFQLLKGSDSPKSARLGFADIIECHIVHSAPNNDSLIEDDNENVVNIKIQGSQPNSTKLFKVYKNEALGTIMQQYADFRKIKITKIKFKFDGEVIKSSQTPEDLDMDEENMVEVQLS